MQQFISEPERKIAVTRRCQVAVAGGGFAGISAALSAARAGAHVILIEQQYTLGGLATLGLITHYLPLCDGFGRQVSFGIAEELLNLSARLSETPDVKSLWRQGLAQTDAGKANRLRYEFNPSVFAILAEQALLRAGVELVYGASVCGVSMDGDCIGALILEGREGRFAIQTQCVVDCSGDAAVCRLAGAKTSVYRQQNILASWYAATQDGAYRVIPLGAADIPDEYKTPEQRQSEQDTVLYSGLTTPDLTQFTIDAHAQILEDFLKKGGLHGGHALAALPVLPEVRMTRKLVGLTELAEPKTPVRFTDSIGLISNWKVRGPVYELPLSCLYGGDVHNLITAGRCISVSDTMWDVTRVIPACAVTGEAAGLAAALCPDFSRIDAAHIQAQLRRRGIPLHTDEL